jgi:ankyrin repeat protein
LLHCVAAAVRPLRVEELAEVLAIDFNTEGIPKLNPYWGWEDPEKVVMSACSNLVIIVKDGDSRIVRFSHFSVKQFLTSDRLAESFRGVSHYHIQLETAHSIIAQACLGILLQFDDRVERDDIEGYPLARYAAQYWATHAQVEDASSRIKDGVECLFDADKPYFSTWLWIYNEDRGSHHSMSTIHPTEPEAVPLYYAARLGFQVLVEHLIAEYPEHVNARGGREMTPMHAAASGGHANTLWLLHEHGADIGSRNKYGETPLHGASWSGKLDAGQCLLDLGADVNARNEDDWTPLFHAIFHGYTEFARMLLEHGAAIEARSVFGSTALHAAVRGGRIQAVRLLLEHGANVNARDSRGWTPSRWKSTLGQEMVELLAEYGAEFGNGPQPRQTIGPEVLPESDREDGHASRSGQPSPDGSLEGREREDSVGLLSPPSSQPSPRASLLGSRNGSATSLVRISGAFRSRSRSRNTSSSSVASSSSSAAAATATVAAAMSVRASLARGQAMLPEARSSSSRVRSSSSLSSEREHQGTQLQPGHSFGSQGSQQQQ